MGRISIIILIIILSIATFFSIDIIYSEKEYKSGILLDKHYEPSKTQTGTAVDGKGNISMITSYYPDEYVLIVDCEKKVEKIMISAEYYYRINAGDTVKFYSLKGYSSGINYGNYEAKF